MLRRYHQCESLTTKEKVIQVCIVEESNTENQPMYCKSTLNRMNEFKELNVTEGQ